MGMCLEDFGKFSIEVRRESFKIAHDDYDPNYPNPEYLISEIDDLIEALQDAKKYIEKDPTRRDSNVRKRETG